MDQPIEDSKAGRPREACFSPPYPQPRALHAGRTLIGSSLLVAGSGAPVGSVGERGGRETSLILRWVCAHRDELTGRGSLLVLAGSTHTGPLPGLGSEAVS